MPGDYISRDRIMSYLNDIWLSVTPNDFMPDEDIEFAKVRCEGIKDAMDAVESIPAADVVEVVRCGECANWQSGWKPSNAKEGTHFCANVGLCTPSDWYCADGEREDGGQEDV